MKNLGIIGCGNMGEAIIKQIQDSRYKIEDIFISEKNTEKLESLKEKYPFEVLGIIDLVKKSDAVIIAVKPQDIDEALHEIKLGLTDTKNKLIISIAAGITSKYIESKLTKRVAVVRVMPNMPGQIGQGISALAKGQFASEEDLQFACDLFKVLGETICILENQMDLVTAISGSGPAYVFYFAHSLIEAAKSGGLKADLAKKLVFQTISGAVALAKETNIDLEDLIKKVTSKGGTTQAALKVFNKKQFKKYN